MEPTIRKHARIMDRAGHILNSLVPEQDSSCQQGLYFQDGSRRVDYILTYHIKKSGAFRKQPTRHGDNASKSSTKKDQPLPMKKNDPEIGEQDLSMDYHEDDKRFRREEFEGNLLEAGLELEKDEDKSGAFRKQPTRHGDNASKSSTKKDQPLPMKKNDPEIGEQDLSMDYHEDDKRFRREEFEGNLLEAGLELEKDEDTKTYGIGFVKIHAPWNVLCREAEFLKLKMPTKKVYEVNHGNNFVEKINTFIHKITEPLHPNLEEKRISSVKHLSYPFSREKQHLFDLSDKDSFFDSKTRSTIDHPRAEYESRVMKKSMKKEHRKRKIGLTFAIVFGVILYRISTAAALAMSSSPSTKSNVRVTVMATAVIINLVVILVLDELYGYIARWLTLIEVPKTDKSFEERLIFKAFVLKFVNAFTPIMYVAFFKGRFVGRPGNYVYAFQSFRMEECAPGGCLMELCIQLSIIMLGKQLIQNNLFEIGIPKLKKLIRYFKSKRTSVPEEEHDKKLQRYEVDYYLEPFAGLTPEYMEMMIQFGFVTLFVASFPLAPLFALLNNIIEIRLDAKKFVAELRRPVAARAKDIDIRKKELEKISSGTDLFRNLMEKGKISVDNTGFLRFLLTSIKREDLLEKLENFEKYGSGERDDLPDGKEIERLETAFEVICDNLGKPWKMFARKIGVSDAKLDQIQDRHPRDMREQIRQVLKAWQKVQGKDAKAAELIKKLRDCGLNLVADNVDKQLSTMQK
ncbi:UNVERIFIED_CONTAM: hypothetical protein FKN15_043739 [Acipenser sinensis]